MKKYMVVYNYALSDGVKRISASFADTEKEADETVEEVRFFI